MRIEETAISPFPATHSMTKSRRLSLSPTFPAGQSSCLRKNFLYLCGVPSKAHLCFAALVPFSPHRNNSEDSRRIRSRKVLRDEDLVLGDEWYLRHREMLGINRVIIFHAFWNEGVGAKGVQGKSASDFMALEFSQTTVKEREKCIGRELLGLDYTRRDCNIYLYGSFIIL